jgi:regulatory protein
MSQADSNVVQSDAQLDPIVAIRHRAMDLLARREHSYLELQQKLNNKFPGSTDQVDQVVCRLQQDNLQSDERFAEVFLSSRVSKGQGPHRVSLELQQRGVNKSLAEAVVAKSGVDWFDLAADVMTKKYGDNPCNGFKERAKRSNFLHYRGFSSEQISACLHLEND